VQSYFCSFRAAEKNESVVDVVLIIDLESRCEDIRQTMKAFSWALVAAASMQSVSAFSVSRPAFSPLGSSLLRMSDNDAWWKKDYDPTVFNNQGGKKKLKDSDQGGEESYGNLFYKGTGRGGGRGGSSGADREYTRDTSQDTSSPWPTTAKNSRRNAANASSFEGANQKATAKKFPVAKAKEVLEGQDDYVAPEGEEVFWQDASSDTSATYLQSLREDISGKGKSGPPARRYHFDKRESAVDEGRVVQSEQAPSLSANAKAQDYWDEEEYISGKEANGPPQTYLYEFDKRKNAVDGGPAVKSEPTWVGAANMKSQDYWGPGPGVNRGVLEFSVDDESSPATTVEKAEASIGRVSHDSDTTLKEENARLRQELREAQAEMKRLKRAINALTSEA
jgi:hypothetical protein